MEDIVDNRPQAARDVYRQIEERYPIWLTRDLDAARKWLRRVGRGSERFGLIASSGAYRLRPEGLHVKAKIDAASWFLNDRRDVRSSFYLEEVATEFDVQGLELDWVGVCWDADFRHQAGAWGFYNFRGTSWQRVNQDERQLYLKNAYRVIMTRARQGMIIFVPEGDASDPTRPPTYYDETYAFLKTCGLTDLGATDLDTTRSPAVPTKLRVSV
ncbi:DNA/RNA helicase domain-containing protein [Aurantimonas sp. C2-6-R+9]|uniref:DNA/RNA helicase domain-containing protein n=1 Tax=unclassified Aurantimonas TaxID=2638230 RepID=UPI002E199B9C|nr:MULTISPECIES: DNA/RNA helicase domain-containing protein [unclassified Aurantimonas]MEC5293122.1 DNA/RNA helicase domain-containing protein [Aurantimonas sp. C2-3-R2]MEC5383226.1 DNA/RNA helicase domain-containing protein [Aurantimonas sp. C2-6-R+9]MEC5414210.1 DNA/RNA helicase domain-containing protein [Aurantimonas sp. C2-4-R8]